MHCYNETVVDHIIWLVSLHPHWYSGAGVATADVAAAGTANSAIATAVETDAEWKMLLHQRQVMQVKAKISGCLGSSASFKLNLLSSQLFAFLALYDDIIHSICFLFIVWW